MISFYFNEIRKSFVNLFLEKQGNKNRRPATTLIFPLCRCCLFNPKNKHKRRSAKGLKVVKANSFKKTRQLIGRKITRIQIQIGETFNRCTDDLGRVERYILQVVGRHRRISRWSVKIVEYVAGLGDGFSERGSEPKYKDQLFIFSFSSKIY